MSLDSIQAPKSGDERAANVWRQKISTRIKVFNVAIPLPIYTVATVPTASDYTGYMIYVSDAAGGAIPAFSDGIAWRRVSDRAVVS